MRDVIGFLRIHLSDLIAAIIQQAGRLRQQIAFWAAGLLLRYGVITAPSPPGAMKVECLP
jgi:hypothetical protein